MDLQVAHLQIERPSEDRFSDIVLNPTVKQCGDVIATVPGFNSVNGHLLKIRFIIQHLDEC